MLNYNTMRTRRHNLLKRLKEIKKQGRAIRIAFGNQENGRFEYCREGILLLKWEKGAFHAFLQHNSGPFFKADRTKILVIKALNNDELLYKHPSVIKNTILI